MHKVLSFKHFYTPCLWCDGCNSLTSCACVCISQWWRDRFRCRIDLLNFSMGFNILAPYMVCVTHKWISPSLILLNYISELVDLVCLFDCEFNSRCHRPTNFTHRVHIGDWKVQNVQSPEEVTRHHRLSCWTIILHSLGPAVYIFQVNTRNLWWIISNILNHILTFSLPGNLGIFTYVCEKSCGDVLFIAINPRGVRAM